MWIVGAVGIAFSVLLSVLTFVRVYGEDRGAIREWRRSVDEKLNAYSKQHNDHYDHSGDTEVHWTPRERDILTNQLDRMAKTQERIEELVRDLLKPRSDLSKHRQILEDRED